MKKILHNKRIHHHHIVSGILVPALICAVYFCIISPSVKAASSKENDNTKQTNNELTAPKYKRTMKMKVCKINKKSKAKKCSILTITELVPVLSSVPIDLDKDKGLQTEETDQTETSILDEADQAAIAKDHGNASGEVEVQTILENSVVEIDESPSQEIVNSPSNTVPESETVPQEAASNSVETVVQNENNNSSNQNDINIDNNSSNEESAASATSITSTDVDAGLPSQTSDQNAVNNNNNNEINDQTTVEQVIDPASVQPESDSIDCLAGNSRVTSEEATLPEIEDKTNNFPEQSALNDNSTEPVSQNETQESIEANDQAADQEQDSQPIENPQEDSTLIVEKNNIPENNIVSENNNDQKLESNQADLLPDTKTVPASSKPAVKSNGFIPGKVYVGSPTTSPAIKEENATGNIDLYGPAVPLEVEISKNDVQGSKALANNQNLEINTGNPATKNNNTLAIASPPSENAVSQLGLRPAQQLTSKISNLNSNSFYLANQKASPSETLSKNVLGSFLSLESIIVLFAAGGFELFLYFLFRFIIR